MSSSSSSSSSSSLQKSRAWQKDDDSDLDSLLYIDSSFQRDAQASPWTSLVQTGCLNINFIVITTITITIIVMIMMMTLIVIQLLIKVWQSRNVSIGFLCLPGQSGSQRQSQIQNPIIFLFKLSSQPTTRFERFFSSSNFIGFLRDDGK